MTIVKVALAVPLRRCFDYLSNESIVPGSRVAVPFGHQNAVMGIAISVHEATNTSTKKLKLIHQTLDDGPVLNSHLMDLCQWCADYYHFSLGEVCQLALPALLRKPQAMPVNTQEVWRITELGKTIKQQDLKANATKQRATLRCFLEHQHLASSELAMHGLQRTHLKTLEAKGWLNKEDVQQQYLAHPLPQDLLREKALTLTEEQQQALTRITTDHFHCYLLEGVTGSGKTEVYLQAMQKVLQEDKQVLVLVPEIGLTPQTLARFQARFNLPVAAVHSGLNDKQRYDIWQQARHHQLRIVLGTRSSIFTPLDKLGLIIIDEEHDLSYKQQEGVRYSARDLAIVRAQKLNIPLILGSATPSLESLHNALSGRYQHLQLRKRTNQLPLPDIECIDVDDHLLHRTAQDAIQQTLSAGQQVLVFINRRGYAPTLMCPDCGWLSQCKRCDSRMTLHRSSSQSLANPLSIKSNQEQWLHCHSCDAKSKAPAQCPQCYSQRLQALGSGTQRSEEALRQHFADASIVRIDRDSMATKGQLENTLEKVHSGKPCILVGTQMLAKGHHFANLGLAVILGLDNAFFSSDFRGAERMGQLLIQVAGRVGREQQQGRVLIQTQFQDHPLLRQLIADGYRSFAETLMAERMHSAMPPWQHLAVIRCHAPQASMAYDFLQEARRQAEHLFSPHTGLQYLGPFAANPEKRNNRYHALLQVKAANRRERQQLLTQLCVHLEKTKQAKSLHWLVDIDPQEF